MNPSHPLRRAYAGARHLARRKLRQINRLSRKSVQMGLLLGGAALVALVSLGFAWLADKALEWNRAWVGHSGWLALLILPPALAALRWLTLRFAPNAAGSGIPKSSAPCRYRPVRGRPAWSRWFRRCGKCRWPFGHAGWRLHWPRRPVGAGGRGRDAGLGRFLEAPWPATARFPRQ